MWTIYSDDESTDSVYERAFSPNIAYEIYEGTVDFDYIFAHRLYFSGCPTANIIDQLEVLGLSRLNRKQSQAA